MSPPLDDDLFARHRFFHAMVIMGGSLALGSCGEATSDGAAASGGAQAASSGGAPGSGGVATGGSATGGIATGGTNTIMVPPPVDAGPFPCAPAQLDCAGQPVLCQGFAYSLPAGCACNAQRPSSAADCAPDQSFLCREALYNEAGNQLTQPVAFDCTCVAQQARCGLACDLAFASNGSSCHEVADDPRSIVCGCAVVVLR